MDNRTIKEILSNIPIESERALLEISDKIFSNEPISEIKKKTTSTAFTIFIGVQTIGCYKSDGWADGIFGNFPEIISYIPDVMRSLQLDTIAKLVEKTIDAFPIGTDFTKRDQDYCDVINFLEGNDNHIKNKQKFDSYSAEKRQQVQEKYADSINRLDSAVETLWGYNASNHEGWGPVMDFLKNNLNDKIWK